MSYASDMGGLGTFGGFGYFGLGAEYQIGSRVTAVQSLQRELQRLHFLASGSGRSGADGYWGPRTATALAAAARYVGFTGAPYTPESGDVARPPPSSVTVPEDLLTRLRSASPAPAGTPGAVVGAPVDATAPVEPQPEAVVIGPSLDPAPSEGNGDGRSGWIPAAAIGGAVLLLGGLIAWQMSPKKKRQAVRANRRRRRRRRRA